MPQGRRKVPFSGKAKKEQLLQKRSSRKKSDSLDDDITPSVSQNLGNSEQITATIQQKEQNDKSEVYFDGVNLPSSNAGRQKYDLIFQKETKREIAEKRELARKPIKSMVDDPKVLEKFNEDFFPKSCDYPIRPDWDQCMSKSQVEANEAKYFRHFVNEIMSQHEQKLSYFELNIETWRQLWRVTEMSDVLLLIVDARYASAMVPGSLIRNLNPKPVVIVLNKIDLIPPALALAWKSYFTEAYQNVKVTFFTSRPAYNLRKPEYDGQGLQFRRLRGRITMAKEGAMQIFDAINELFSDKIDLTSWREKIENSSAATFEDEEKTPNEGKNMLTIGLIGHPNVGKSSLINSLMGKIVVSVSKTPGHTKHFQTIHVTSSVKLCDCPGLVFPSLIPKPLQVLMGSYPIAQTREPYSVILFLAERIGV